ncbi:hypothetical protein [Echinimonas agarilytica]|uniref:Uncharacterized protein n=1 Tax=Echinimonas agarilytica TaxID=1215918 RepID=A0AA41W3V9_9GAMM|nr:hypothetical protein [Echinimonas agarilytica]MCM2678209.1 hypothetical protein [Echinimonas agarilytica]
MNWLADNARFTLAYKHLASRNCAAPTEIPEHWQQPLAQELKKANACPWQRCSGKQKLLHVVHQTENAGIRGLQPRHWLRGCSNILKSPAKFGQVIIIALLLVGITLVHTDYLLLEISRQYANDQTQLPNISKWVLDYGKIGALALTVFMVILSIMIKLQRRVLRLRIEKLNIGSRWMGPNVMNHSNIAVCGFWLSKLHDSELKDYLSSNEIDAIHKIAKRHDLQFIAKDSDCAELIWKNHIECAISASERWEKRLTYLGYLLLAGWFCLVLMAVAQAFLGWGKLGL